MLAGEFFKPLTVARGILDDEGNHDSVRDEPLEDRAREAGAQVEDLGRHILLGEQKPPCPARHPDRIEGVGLVLDSEVLLGSDDVGLAPGHDREGSRPCERRTGRRVHGRGDSPLLLVLRQLDHNPVRSSHVGVGEPRRLVHRPAQYPDSGDR